MNASAMTITLRQLETGYWRAWDDTSDVNASQADMLRINRLCTLWALYGSEIPDSAIDDEDHAVIARWC